MKRNSAVFMLSLVLTSAVALETTSCSRLKSAAQDLFGNAAPTIKCENEPVDINSGTAPGPVWVCEGQTVTWQSTTHFSVYFEHSPFDKNYGPVTYSPTDPSGGTYQVISAPAVFNPTDPNSCGYDFKYTLKIDGDSHSPYDPHVIIIQTDGTHTR